MPNARIPNGIGKRDARSWVSNPSLGAMTWLSLRRRLKYLPMYPTYPSPVQLSGVKDRNFKRTLQGGREDEHGGVGGAFREEISGNREKSSVSHLSNLVLRHVP